MARELSRKKGAIFSILAAMCFAAVGILMQFAEQYTSQSVVIFFRQLFSLLTIIPILLWQMITNPCHGITICKTKYFSMHIWRTIFGLLQLYALLYALSLLSLSNALVLSYTRALFTPLMIWLWYKKKLEKAMWIGILLGFIGTIFILKPEGQIHHLGTFVGLLSGFFGTCSNFAMRRLAKKEPPIRILLYFFVLSIAVSAIPLLWSWQTPKSNTLWGSFILIGILGTIYQLFLTLSYHFAKPSYTNGFLYLAIIFTMLYESIWQKKAPDVYSIIGTILIFIGTLLVGFIHSSSNNSMNDSISGSLK